MKGVHQTAHTVLKQASMRNFAVMEVKIMSEGLKRFLEAQICDYDRALQEIKNGCKQTHWMWYIFPQLKGLGRSTTAEYYGIADIEEARQYLAHPVLGTRLKEISAALLTLDTNDPYSVMGGIDGLKLCSSMTLFAEIEGLDSVFGKVIRKFYNGCLDAKTNELLHGSN